MMADEAVPQVPAASTEILPVPHALEPEIRDVPATSGAALEANATNDIGTSEPVMEEVATTSAPEESKTLESAEAKQIVSDTTSLDKPATTQEGAEMDDQNTDASVRAAVESVEATQPSETAVDSPATADKSKGRRKSGGVPEHKTKKLAKKASKAKMTHADAKPGDYFMVRLKGYPLWPAIVCDETMLPQTLIKSRPVTAARPDGTYRADYEDGGPRVKDRTFPVMYLHTNEFGWIPNYDLVDVDLDTIGEAQSSTRKDLQAAHKLAAEKHDLDYFKEVLRVFMEAKAEQEAEKQEKEAAKAAKKASKAKRKSKSTADDDADGDVDMPDADAEADSEEADATGSAKPKSKKRKADEDANAPQRSDSVKKAKPTIKLSLTNNNTAKPANGTSTPKSAKDTSKPKSSKPKTAAKKEIPEAPKEPELTLDEKRVKKEKEILFLRHKLQKGMLTRDQEPKEDEMKQMSEFVTKLEGYADLEVSIIRATKIHKVLKAILKLSKIPKEEELRFKPRSQTLLEKWNKILASEEGTPSAGPPAATNGVSNDTKIEAAELNSSSHDGTNGANEETIEQKVEEQVSAPISGDESATAAGAQLPESHVSETKEAPVIKDTAAPKAEEAPQESVPEPATIEFTA